MSSVQQKNFGFGLRAFKKFPELLPLAVIMGCAVTGATAFSYYAAYTKPDVVINKGAEVPPFERIKPDQSVKLLKFNQKYEQIPELEALKKEIGSYKA